MIINEPAAELAQSNAELIEEAAKWTLQNRFKHSFAFLRSIADQLYETSNQKLLHQPECRHSRMPERLVLERLSTPQCLRMLECYLRNQYSELRHIFQIISTDTHPALIEIQRLITEHRGKPHVPKPPDHDPDAIRRRAIHWLSDAPALPPELLVFRQKYQAWMQGGRMPPPPFTKADLETIIRIFQEHHQPSSQAQVMDTVERNALRWIMEEPPKNGGELLPTYHKILDWLRADKISRPKRPLTTDEFNLLIRAYIRRERIREKREAGIIAW